MGGYLSIFEETTNYFSAIQQKIDVVFLQAGVGSFAASAVWFYINNYGYNKPRLILVEPQEADGCLTSIKKGSITPSTGNGETKMSGLNCLTPSFVAWPILKMGIDAFMAVKDVYAKMAVLSLNSPRENDEQISSAESGAAGLAGLLTILKEDSFLPLRKAMSINNHSNVLIFNTEGPIGKF